MRYNSCTLSGLPVDSQEIYRSLGYGNGHATDDISFLTEEVLGKITEICNARYMYAIFPGKVQDKVSVEINGISFHTGRIITSYLDKADRFCVFITTAGKEYDDYKRKLREEGDFVREFIADAIGSVIAEACVTKISEEIHNLGMNHTYPYSPGYCGWKLTEQRQLFSLFPESPCGVELTDSCLMLPIKSISGIMGIGDNITQKAYGCSICENINCYKRKTI